MKIIPPVLVLLAAATTAVAQHQSTFRYEDASATSVAVAGEFNDWHAAPMEPGDDGTWTLTIDLPAGTHGYKFLVNGEQWMFDPANLDRTTVAGVENSAITVGDTGAAADGAAQPAPVAAAPASEPAPTPGAAGSDNASVSFDDKTNDQLLEGRFKFPRGTFHADFLPEAQAKARAENKPVALLYTDKDTSCGLCNSAAGTMVAAFRSRAVLVYVRDLRSLPRHVAKELSARGQYIPKLALFDADLANSYGLVTYEEVKAEGDRPLRALKKKI